MNLMDVFTLWLTAYSLIFTFLPLSLLNEWRKRGTADGFSSVNFVLPILMMSCWYKYALLTNDPVNKFINGFNLLFFSLYIFGFWWYQIKRKPLYYQLSALVLSILLVFGYVETYTVEKRADVMGTIAASCQILSLSGGVYDIMRAISLKTTEYIPASIQFGIFGLTIQWTIFAVAVSNFYMLIANIAALIINVSTILLYFVYPPRTWRVPILNVGDDGDKKAE